MHTTNIVSTKLYDQQKKEYCWTLLVVTSQNRWGCKLWQGKKPDGKTQQDRDIPPLEAFIRSLMCMLDWGSGTASLTICKENWQNKDAPEKCTHIPCCSHLDKPSTLQSRIWMGTHIFIRPCTSWKHIHTSWWTLSASLCAILLASSLVSCSFSSSIAAPNNGLCSNREESC